MGKHLTKEILLDWYQEGINDTEKKHKKCKN